MAMPLVAVAGLVVLTYKVLEAEVFWIVSILEAEDAASSVAEDVPTELLVIVIEPEAPCVLTTPITFVPEGSGLSS